LQRAGAATPGADRASGGERRRWLTRPCGRRR
jgi:hypothetical protein